MHPLDLLIRTKKVEPGLLKQALPLTLEENFVEGTIVFELLCLQQPDLVSIQVKRDALSRDVRLSEVVVHHDEGPHVRTQVERLHLLLFVAALLGSREQGLLRLLPLFFFLSVQVAVVQEHVQRRGLGGRVWGWAQWVEMQLQYWSLAG